MLVDFEPRLNCGSLKVKRGFPVLQTSVLPLSQKANRRRKVQLDAGEGGSTVCSDGSGRVRRFTLEHAKKLPPISFTLVQGRYGKKNS